MVGGALIIELNSENKEQKSTYDVRYFANQIQHELINKQSFSPYAIGDYKKQDVENALKNPEKSWKQLINISMYISSISGTYRSLILYMSNMATFDGFIKKQIINPEIDKIDMNTLLKSYMIVNKFYNKTELKHEGNKIMSYVFRDGIYYGYLIEGKDSSMFIRLPIHICSHDYMEDGTYTVYIDLKKITKDIIETLPEKVREAYKIYKKQRSNNIFKLDSKKGIVIRCDNLLPYPIPFFSHIFPDIYDLKDYKQLKKDRAETDNYKLITLEIPVDSQTKTSDNLMLSQSVIENFTEVALSVVEKSIGVLPTPMKATPIQFAKSMADNNHVKDITTYIYDNASVNQLLFNGENSVALKYSLERDASTIYSILRQFERWYNRRFKLEYFNNSDVIFKLQLLDVTVYNKENYIKTELSLAQSSFPNKEIVAALRGINIQELIGQDLIENKLYVLGNTWTPLKTSHTQSSDSTDGGATEKDVGDLTDSGEQSREDDTNIRR